MIIGELGQSLGDVRTWDVLRYTDSPVRWEEWVWGEAMEIRAGRVGRGQIV